ncbi:MAG: flagellar basal body rod protein FlgC [Dehalococcoidia bacterium]
MSLFKVFDVAGSALNAQSLRLNVVASNLANAESVAPDAKSAYRARHPVFQSLLREFGADPLTDDVAVGVRMTGVYESPAPAARRYEPGHPLADTDGYVFASNVNAVEEMANMISASRSFQTNVEVMTTSRDLLMKTITMGR